MSDDSERIDSHEIEDQEKCEPERPQPEPEELHGMLHKLSGKRLLSSNFTKSDHRRSKK